MADIFTRTWSSADLEAYTSGTEGTASVIESTTTAGRSGGYGIRAYIAGQAAQNDAAWARYQYTYPSGTNVVEAEAWVYRVTNPGGDGITSVFALRQEAPVYNYIASVRYSGTTYDSSWTFSLRCRDGSTLGTTITLPGSTGTWQQWRIVYDRSGANPVAKFIVDGTEITTLTDTTSGTALAPDLVELGLFEVIWSATQTEFYYDDLTVRDAQTPLTVNPVDYRAAGLQLLSIIAPEATVQLRVPKIWTFTSNAEGLTDAGTNANITFQYDGTAQAVEFVSTTASMSTQTERGVSPNSDTWSSWGVPSNRRVTSVRFDSLQETTAANSLLTLSAGSLRIVDASLGNTVTTGNANNLVNYQSWGTSVDGAPVTFNTTQTQSVNTSFQSPTSNVRLLIEHTFSTDANTTLQTSNLASVSTRNSTTTNYSLAPPIPSGVTANSTLLVAVWYSRTANASANVTISSGWTERVRDLNTTSGLMGVWTRTYQTGDSAPTINGTGHVTGTSGDTALAMVFGLDNVDLSNPIAATGTVGSFAANVNIGPIAGVTVPANGYVMVVGGKKDDWTSVATLTGEGLTWVELAEVFSTQGADAGLVVGGARNSNTGSTAIANKTFTVTGGTSVVGRGVMIAFNPRPLTPNVEQRYDTITISIFADETNYERAANPLCLCITAPEVAVAIVTSNNVSRSAGISTVTTTALATTLALGVVNQASGTQSVTVTAPTAASVATIAKAGGAQLVTITSPNASIAVSARDMAAGAQVLSVTAPEESVTTTIALTAGAQSVTVSAPEETVRAVLSVPAGQQTLTPSASEENVVVGASAQAAGVQILTLDAPNVTVFASGGTQTLSAGQQTVSVTAPNATLGLATARVAGNQAIALTVGSYVWVPGSWTTWQPGAWSEGGATVVPTISLGAGTQSVTLSAPTVTVVTTASNQNVAAGQQTLTVTSPVSSTAVGVSNVAAGAQSLTITAPTAGYVTSVATGAANTIITLTAPSANVTVTWNAPQFRSDSITTYASRTGNTTITPPAGVANGDILVLIALAVTTSTDYASLVLPTGFTILKGYPIYFGANTASSGRVRVYAAWKRANNESGDYVVTHHPAGASFNTQGYIMAVSGAKSTGTPIIDISRNYRYGDTVGSGNTATATGVNVTVANSLVGFFSVNWGAAGTVPPSGSTPTFTERQDTVLLYTATGPLGTAQLTGDKTQNLATTAANTPWAAGMFVITPVEEPATGAGTVTKVWNFNTDAEGLADAGTTASITFQYDSANGVQFVSTTSNLTLASEKARRATTGQTWETWGVPSGKKVTHITLNGVNERTVNATAVTANHLKLRVIDASGNPIHADDLLANAWLSISNSTDGGYANLALQSSYVIYSNSQPSTTDVRLEIEQLLSTNASAANVDQRIDSISLTIHYQNIDSVTLSEQVITISVPATTLLVGATGYAAGAQPVTLTAPGTTTGITRALSAGAQLVTLTAPDVTVQTTSGTQDRAAGQQSIAVTAPGATVALAVVLSAGTQSITTSAPEETLRVILAVTGGTQSATLTAPVATVTTGSSVVAAGTQSVTLTAPTVTVGVTAVQRSAGPQSATITVPVPTVVSGSVAYAAGSNTLTSTAGAVTVATSLGVASGQTSVTLIAPTTSHARGQAAGLQAVTVTAPEETVATTVGVSAGPQLITLVAPNALISGAGQLNASIITLTAPTVAVAVTAVAQSAGAQSLALTAPAQTQRVTITQTAGAQSIATSAPEETVGAGAITGAAGSQTLTLTAPLALVSAGGVVSASLITITAPVTTVVTTVARTAGAQSLAVTAPEELLVVVRALDAGTQSVAITAPSAGRSVGTSVVAAGAQTVTISAPTTTGAGELLRAAGQQTVTAVAPSATIRTSTALTTTQQSIAISNSTVTVRTTVTVSSGQQPLAVVAPEETVTTTRMLPAGVSGFTISAPVVQLNVTRAVVTDPMELTITPPVAVPVGGSIAVTTDTAVITFVAPTAVLYAVPPEYLKIVETNTVSVTAPSVFVQSVLRDSSFYEAWIVPTRPYVWRVPRAHAVWVVGSAISTWFVRNFKRTG